ncbi:MAG: LysR family transcriptional regulator [Gammaproteobacteria bacterium]|nr:MAG: LysR family transcriptional regulator [Gammaproteobacteria bacterium]
MRVTHLNGLKALEATLRTGSFRAAADELGVTTAAVGQQIRTLENFLGVKLFLRTSSGVQPTDHACRIERKLTASFSSIEDVINQLRYHQPKNRLAITLPSSFAENWFAGRLPDFYRLNSEIDLRLDASNRMVDLLTEDFDFAIRYGQPSPEIYDEVHLFGDFVLPVCTPEFAKQYRLPGKQRSLEGVPLIHLVERTPDPQWVDWTGWGKAFNFRQDSLQPGIRLTEFNSGIQTAIRGQGLVLCGIIEAYGAIREGILVTPFGPRQNCPTSYQYRLVSVHGRELSKLQQQFQSWMITTAKKFRSEVSELVSKI